MKNAFIASSLIITAGYFVAVAAATFGIVSLRLPSFTAVIGAYAAVGVLAFAFRDYSRHSRYDARPALQRSPRPDVRSVVHSLSLTNPTLHAN